MPVKFKVYPVFGDPYIVTIEIPEEYDHEEFIDVFVDYNLKNVDDWCFC